MSINNQSLFEDIIVISSRLPPWACSILAIFSFLFFHQYANLTPPTLSNPPNLFEPLLGMFFKTLAFFLQFVLPAGFIIGAVSSLLARVSRFGFIYAGKSLIFALLVSFISILVAALFVQPPPPSGSSGSASVPRLFNLSPFQKNVAPQSKEHGKTTTNPANREYTKEEIESAKEKALNDRTNSTMYEIRLNSGRSMFAKHVTEANDSITLENEGGLQVTLRKQDVMKINKLK